MSNEKGIKSYIYKICVVGDGGVGKTSMVLRYTDNKFKENYIMTIGTNFGMKSIKLPEKPGDKVILQIWDLAGQDQFQTIRPLFYQGAKSIVYVFDLTRKNSIVNLFKWKEEVEQIVGSIPCILVGNKLDLVNYEKKKADKEEVDFVKTKLNASSYFETSAKAGFNIDNAFMESAKCIFETECNSEDIIKY
jgi:small GTP-binding protein